MSAQEAGLERSLARGTELRPVPGPSAIAGGRRRFFNLLWVMSLTEFRLTFHGTVLGYFWSLARPLLTFGVLLAVFTQVFRLGDAVPDYPALLLLNVMLFTLFGESTNRAVTSLVAREGVVRRTQFPRLVIPLSVVLTEAFNLVLNLAAVFVFIVVYGVEPRWTWLLLPVIVLALLVITVAFSMLLSAVYPRVRDVALIWSVLATVLFYGSPILYPIESAPQTFRDIVQLNPLSPIFEQAHKWIIDPSAPGALEAVQGSEYLLVISAAIYRRDLRVRRPGLPPRGPAHRRGAVIRRAGSRARSGRWRTHPGRRDRRLPLARAASRVPGLAASASPRRSRCGWWSSTTTRRTAARRWSPPSTPRWIWSNPARTWASPPRPTWGPPAATASFLLVLNPDTAVTEGALDAVIAALESDPNAAVAGPRLLRPDGSFDHAARRSFPTPLSALGHFSGVGRRPGAPGRLAAYRAPEVESGRVDAVNGAFMLDPARALRAARGASTRAIGCTWRTWTSATGSPRRDGGRCTSRRQQCSTSRAAPPEACDRPGSRLPSTAA